MHAIGAPGMDGSVPGYRTNGERMTNEVVIMAAIREWVLVRTSGMLRLVHSFPYIANMPS